MQLELRISTTRCEYILLYRKVKLQRIFCTNFALSVAGHELYS